MSSPQVARWGDDLGGGHPIYGQGVGKLMESMAAAGLDRKLVKTILISISMVTTSMASRTKYQRQAFRTYRDGRHRPGESRWWPRRRGSHGPVAGQCTARRAVSGCRLPPNAACQLGASVGNVQERSQAAAIRPSTDCVSRTSQKVAPSFRQFGIGWGGTGIGDDKYFVVHHHRIRPWQSSSPGQAPKWSACRYPVRRQAFEANPEPGSKPSISDACSRHGSLSNPRPARQIVSGSRRSRDEAITTSG